MSLVFSAAQITFCLGGLFLGFVFMKLPLRLLSLVVCVCTMRAALVLKQQEKQLRSPCSCPALMRALVFGMAVCMIEEVAA